MTDRSSTTYRAKSDEVDEAFEEVREEFKKVKNNQEYGKNGALNYAVLLAREFLHQLNGQIRHGKKRKSDLAEDITG